MRIQSFAKLTLSVLVLAFASACVQIPESYVGSYLDPVSGAKLSLLSNQAELLEPSGRKLKGKVKALSFERLLGGKSGIQINNNSKDPKKVELFWVFPRVETRKEAAGMVWLEAEVIYALLDNPESKKASRLEVFQCRNGTVLLDVKNSDWQIGCPETASYYDFHRIKEEG
ncbi:MAG: hypothetical protein A2X94_01535 [Bdellovibrionales bacterium GWB1_55_8]|nr:MAG: hypothetical protein A2X94_01535 [Bdellovibrionales bacterium GWB1_55_8]